MSVVAGRGRSGPVGAGAGAGRPGAAERPQETLYIKEKFRKSQDCFWIFPFKFFIHFLSFQSLDLIFLNFISFKGP